jgi:hypothetical protein
MNCWIPCEERDLRKFAAYTLILLGILGLVSGFFYPLGDLGAFFLAGGLVAIGIGGGLRK